MNAIYWALIVLVIIIVFLMVAKKGMKFGGKKQGMPQGPSAPSA
jgi:hypothetical protein